MHRNISMTRDTDQQGLTLKEILILFACIAIVGIVSINVYVRLMERAKTINLINQTATIINNTFAFYKGHPPYKDLNNATAIELELIPAEMIHGKNKIQHPFKGSVIIRSLYENQGFTLVYRDLPSTVCRVIATTYWGGSDSGLKYMFVDNQKRSIPKRFPQKLAENQYDTSQIPLPKEDAAVVCKCKRNNCSVTFIYQ